jgi:LysM repeat protein
LFAAIVMGIAVVAPTSVEAAPKTHTVAAGQSLWKIAHRYHVSVDALCHQNGLDEGDALRTGQVLTIPDGKAKATGTQPTTKPGQKANSPANKPETGQKSTREAKPSGGLPPLAKATRVSASDDAADREEQPVPKTTPAARSKQNHAAAKPTHAKPAPAANKSARRHKSSAKSPASEPKRDHKSSAEPAAAKSPRKGTGDSDEGD